MHLKITTLMISVCSKFLFTKQFDNIFVSIINTIEN